MSNNASLAPNIPASVHDHETATSIVGAFVESPISYTSEAVTYDAWSPLKALSVELLEEIVGHPPNSSIGSLALISKKFGTQFRFRHVHSWQEHYSIQKFSLIARENQVALTDNFVPKHEPRIRCATFR